MKEQPNRFSVYSFAEETEIRREACVRVSLSARLGVKEDELNGESKR